MCAYVFFVFEKEMQYVKSKYQDKKSPVVKPSP